jgi:hypothetical protein
MLRATAGARIAAVLEDLHNEKCRRAARMTPDQRLAEIAELSTSFDSLMSAFSAPSKCRPGDTARCDNITVIRHITSSFKSKGVDLVVGGSIAAMLLVPPRASVNINLNARISTYSDDMATMVRSLEGVDTDTYACCDQGSVGRRYVKSSFVCRRWPVEVYFADGDVVDRALSCAVVVSDLKFAPPECLCVWKMHSLPRSRCYHKDRGDVVGILSAVSTFDNAWVRSQLKTLDGGEGARVLEWDGLYRRWFLHRPPISEDQ